MFNSGGGEGMLRQKWPNSDHFFEGSIKVKRTPASNDVEVKCNYYSASSWNFFPFKSLMHITESTAHVKKTIQNGLGTPHG
jgi:hypothetical protein